jgi:hypothetical protein
VSERPTKLDRLLNRVKNQKLAVWILAFGVSVIALSHFTNALQDIWTFLRPAPEAEAPQASKPASGTSRYSGLGFGSAVCKYFLLPPFVGPNKPYQRESGDGPLELTVEGVTVTLEPEERSLPSVLLFRGYEPKDYAVRLTLPIDRSIFKYAGAFTLYQGDTYYTYGPPNVGSDRISFPPMPQSFAEDFMKTWKLTTLPRCEPGGKTLTWQIQWPGTFP